MSTLTAPLPPVAPRSQVPGPYALVSQMLRPQPDPPKRKAWLKTARENQLPPSGTWWFVWFILAGRGFGKTRSGAEHTAQFMRENPGAEVGVVGRTDAEARRLLLNGPSGLLAVLEPWEVKRCVQSPGDTILELHNGAKCYVTGANSPDALRGLNLWMAWCVAEGELVATARGDVPIETVAPGDLVMTRQGWRRVSAATRTKRDAETVVVSTDDGRRLRCTPDHRVWTETRGWVRADSVTPSDTMLAWQNVPDSVVAHAAHVTAVVSVGPSSTSDVYDLTVDGAHEFYAGGLLVHNCDELAAWRYQRIIWDEVLEPAVRIGPHPHILVTTTPKPTKLVRTLLKDTMAHIVRGSTFENAANLSAAFIRRMKAKYDGTRTGRQELYAEVLDDVPGALVTADQLEASRINPTLDDDGLASLDIAAPSAKLNGLYREAVVALDPADGTDEGDEQALALVGLGYDHELYIEHTDGVKMSVTEYLGMAVDLAIEHQATIVVEKNHGGKYLIATLEQVMKERGVVVPVRVVTASEGKRTRAEPIVPLFLRNKLHFVGQHPDVEDQLTSWVGAAGEKSPDRMDAVVWGVTHFLRHRLAEPDHDDAGAYAYAQKAGATDWAEDYDDDGTYDYA